MKVVIYARPDAPHQVQAAEAMQAGFARHGIDAPICTAQEYEPSDLAVVWSAKNRLIMGTQHRRGADVLIMERGYIGDRFKWTSLAFNGLNGRGEFHAEHTPLDRGLEFCHLVQPWTFGGDYYLIAGQCLGDAALDGVDFLEWVRSLPEEIDGKPVLFRPHPSGSWLPVPHPVTRGTLDEDLQNAAGLITWNSNSAVDALLRGVPAVAYDIGSMVYRYVGNKIDKWVRPDRDKIVARLAACQWTLEEMARGAAWEQLGRRYD